MGSVTSPATLPARIARAPGLAVRATAIRLGAPLTVCAALIGAWWLLVVLAGWPEYVVPTPPEVWRAMAGQGAGFAPDLWTTTQEILLGFGLGVVAGLVLATLMSFWHPVKLGIYPVLIFSQVVPIFVISVVVTVVFVNDGLVPQILVTALYSFLPVVVTAVDGLDGVDDDLVRLLRSAGASRLRIFATVRFPASLPSIFSGAKLAMVFAVSAAPLSEWIGGGSGLGVYMRDAINNLQIPQVFGGAIVVSSLGATLVAAVAAVEFVALPWNHHGREIKSIWRSG